MTKANECTCPSGDGSLRHPCPAHPASVELAGVAANLTFINGRPAMCGCQVEYSSGGGEYSDVIYVTLCAKHSGSAILDLVATNRIALTPEYEGQWHADLYLDREIPLAKAEGATPAEAVLALMSAERIDPEQESVEQAGGDEREAFEKIHTVPRGIMWNEEKSQYVRVHEKHCSLRTWNSFVALWAGWMARAALAQPSPKSGYYSDQEWINAGCPPEQPSPVQAEQAERPEVVARVVHSTPVVLDQCAPLNANDEMMTVAQHAASVARWAEMFNRVEQERDAALARVAELDKQCRDDVARALGLRPSQERGFAWSYLLASIKSCVKASEDAAQAQHSVREGWRLVPVEQLLNMMSDKDHDTRIMAERQLLAVLAAAPGTEVPQAWLDVQAERRRQVTAEGWTPEHDDEHNGGELADAAACYALWAGGINPGNWREFWPWAPEWLKHSEPRRMLVKAGALILAEIERLDRAATGKEGL